MITAGLMSLSALAQKNGVTNLGKNIVRFNPISVFAYGGVGFGMGYERILDDDGKFGMKIPFHLGMMSNGGNNITNYALMINPGIKFYPNGQRKATYGLGVSLFGITGTNDRYTGQWGGVQMHTPGSRFHLGMMIDNSVQFNLTPKLNIGMELGLGPSYINNYTANGRTSNDPLQFMAAFNFHVGYRF